MKRLEKKKNIFVICMIMVLSLVMMPMTIVAEEVLAETEIEFTGSTYNEETDTSVWNYRVTSGEQPSLSHWNLATCEEHSVKSVSDHWIETEESIDGSTGFLGLKFEQSMEANDRMDVWFEVEGNWETGLIDAMTKSGLGFEEIQVEGPTCIKVDGNEVIVEEEAVIDEEAVIKEDIESDDTAVINLDASAVVETIPEDAVLLTESEKLSVYLSVDGDLLIHANTGGESTVSGTWELKVGGQIYIVEESMNETIITIEEPPVGTYQVSAAFAAPSSEESETEEAVVTIAVPTVTGGELPETATPYYNVLLIGALLALVGMLIMYRVKRLQ